MTLKDASAVVVTAAVLAMPAAAALPRDELPCESRLLCPEHVNDEYCRTSQLWFEAESASGAQGDVVPVTISLHFAPDFDLEFSSISLAVCHDPVASELVGEPVYSDELLGRNPLRISFVRVDENEDPRHTGYGFSTWIGPVTDRSPVGGKLPLLTAYYRLLGDPGEISVVSFCDGQYLKFGPAACNFNGITDVRVRDQRWPLLSTRNQHGLLTVREGPTTRPERPPEPPEAIVYSERPASEEVALRVRIEDTVAAPGDRDVPIGVFVTAGVEYTGVIIPVDFDERFLRVASVEDHFVAGTALFDNTDAFEGAQPDEGYVVLASSIIGDRRIAPAGEEFRAATIYLDVLEVAAELTETTLEPRPVGGRVGDPFIIVRHLDGSLAEEVEVRGEFGAVEISPGALAIRPSLETMPGDANLDGAFDISDPVSVLGFLFAGDELLCPPAADYDGDGQLLITDPIRMLGVLFNGYPAHAEGSIDCR